MNEQQYFEQFVGDNPKLVTAYCIVSYGHTDYITDDLEDLHLTYTNMKARYKGIPFGVRTMEITAERLSEITRYD